MDHVKAEKLFSTMKAYGVEYFKNADLEIKMSSNVNEAAPTKVQPKRKTEKPVLVPPQQAVPIVDQSIPHHENEVAKLLKLSDEDLVDKLFPDYSQMPVRENV